MTCQVTGEVSDGNLSLAEGKIILSKEGAEQILNEPSRLYRNSKISFSIMRSLFLST